MAPLAERLVGRADELGALQRILDELARGRPGAIELAGEPGIGKTRLLTELTARAEARGHLVLAGAASELERDLPFSVFVDALDQYAAGASLDGQAARNYFSSVGQDRNTLSWDGSAFSWGGGRLADACQATLVCGPCGAPSTKSASISNATKRLVSRSSSWKRMSIRPALYSTPTRKQRLSARCPL